MSVKDDLGRDARIATANHHDLRMLSGFGELLEAASFERKPRCLKGMIAIYEPRRKFHADHYPGEALLAAMSIVKVLRQTSSSASGHGIHHKPRRCREVPMLRANRWQPAELLCIITR